QVALDVRLWTRDTVDRVEGMLRDLQAALIDRAEEYASTIMPGFTHLQTAQPITFGHHLLAYVEMFGRDRSRLRDCRERMNESPLGAAPLAEEIVIWCSAPFRFIALSDAFTTGSSIMPQKRNPDAAELIRGKVGRIMGAFVALCTLLKGLPLTYGKDMQ